MVVECLNDKRKKKEYKKLTLRNRRVIETMLNNYYTKSEIARKLKMNKTTIYREIERNSVDGVYNAETANKLAHERSRWEQEKRKRERLRNKTKTTLD